MDSFIFKEISSNDFGGLIVNSLPPIIKPLKRTNKNEIDGVDGDLIEELGYAAYDKPIKITLTKEIDVNEIINWLNGSGKLVMSNEPDKYYQAEIIDTIEFERFFKFEPIIIKFHVQPYKYKYNEQPTKFEGAELIENTKEVSINSNGTPLDNVKFVGELEQATGKNIYPGSKDFSGTWKNDSQWETDTTLYNGLVVKKRNEAWNGICKDIFIEANKQYTFSCFVKANENVGCAIYVGGGTIPGEDFTSQSKDFTATTNWTRYSHQFTASTSGIIKPRIEQKSAKTTIYICGYMLEEGELSDYTPNSPPIPDNPSPIKVVGDNINYYDETRIDRGHYYNPSGVIASNGTWCVTEYFIPVKPNSKVIARAFVSGTTNQFQIVEFDANYNLLIRNQEFVNPLEITTSTNTRYIKVGNRIDTGMDKIKVSFENTSYTPYNRGGINYKIAGKNKFNYTQSRSGTSSGITSRNNGDGSYTYSGTATDKHINIWYAGVYLTNYTENQILFTLEPGRYLVQDCMIFKGTSGMGPTISERKNIYTISQPYDVTGIRAASAVNGSTYNETVYPMICKLADGESDADFEPYKEQKETIILPDKYQAVEYIASTGTQFIDTGFKPNQDTRVTIKTSIDSSKSASWIFGARSAANSNTYSLLNTVISTRRLRSDYNTTADSHSTGTTVPTNTTITIDKNKNITSVLEDSSIVFDSIAYANFNSPVSLYLMNRNENNSIDTSTGFAGKIYFCKIYDNGVLVRDYIPCYRKSDNVSGMYDRINNQFYSNAGTGSFVVGPAIDMLLKGEFMAKIENAEDYIENGVLNKIIRKTVLDGNQNVERFAIGATGKYKFGVTGPADMKTTTEAILNANLIVSNKLKEVSNAEQYNNLAEGILVRANNTNQFLIYIGKCNQMTIEEFKTYLSQNPIEIYYVLANPYQVELEDSEKEKLRNLPTYKGTTNIETTAPLYAKYYKYGILSVTNEGLEKSLPIIRIKGKGTITVYHKGIQVFTYSFISSDEVVIDSKLQDAYLDNELKNRNMNGDFIKLDPGENEITYDGSIEEISIFPESRWL